MEILPIFEPWLYAFRYENETQDEFERVFELWSDPMYLEDFFELNKEKLAYFKTDVITAIHETRNESETFESELLEIAETQEPPLDAMFKNLNDEETRVYEFSKQKSKRRWLRIYALRIDKNVYVVTGGANKLTKRMEDGPDTSKELSKLEKCRNFLNENDVSDIDTFKELVSKH
jgi:hypothetical protein